MTINPYFIFWGGEANSPPPPSLRAVHACVRALQRPHSDNIATSQRRRLCVMPATRRRLSEPKNHRRRRTVVVPPPYRSRTPAVTMTSSSRDGGCRQQLAPFVPLYIIAAMLLSIGQGEAVPQTLLQQLLSARNRFYLFPSLGFHRI